MTTLWLTAPALFAATAMAAALATWLVLRLLERRAIYDHPNERSSHSRPTPRGGGLAVVAIVAVAWSALFLCDPSHTSTSWLMIGGLIALAALSWLDDLRGLSAGLRIAGHAVVVAIVLACLPAADLVFQGLLPPLADRLIAGLLWIWFINLFNFMDGIDGISGVEAIAIGGGVFLLATILGMVNAGLPALALAGAVAGFLVWNWHPARLFLGDVGSVPLGFALGGLLLATAMAGHWAAALILPLYYLADATITLARRAARREKVWQAHREHFYQQAAARGIPHDAIARAIALANLVLIGLAVGAELGGVPAKLAALAAAAFTVALLLRHLAGGFGRGPIAPGRDV